MEEMTYLFTALGIFNKTTNKLEMEWDKYIEWSKLTHLTEVVSLDGMLNGHLVEPDFSDAYDWKFIHTTEHQITGFYKTVEYVLQKCGHLGNFNLLSVTINPAMECKDIVRNDYEFMGYELLDDEYCVSVLTNCRSGVGEEPFMPTEINKYGLINDYLVAHDIKKRVWENNPESDHSKTIVIAVWRHKTIGQKY